MPPIEERDLTDTAVVWIVPSRYDAYGEPIVSDPFEVRCRWVEKKSVAVNANGDQISTDVTAPVDRYIPPDSNMALGTLQDWGIIGTDKASDVGSIMVVIYCNSTPDFRGREFRYEVGLKKHRDTLPTVAQ
jgi:hypothetical protein